MFYAHRYLIFCFNSLDFLAPERQSKQIDKLRTEASCFVILTAREYQNLWPEKIFHMFKTVFFQNYNLDFFHQRFSWQFLIAKRHRIKQTNERIQMSSLFIGVLQGTIRKLTP